MTCVNSREAGLAVLRAAGMSTERCLGFAVEFEPGSEVVIHARYSADPKTIEEVIRVVTLGSTPGQNAPGGAPR